MTDFNGFKAPDQRIEDIDLPRIGAEIGVGEDEIHALIDVEASGSGADKKGRLKALYEPHKAYKLSSGETRKKLVAAGLAYPKWGEKKYPADSYPRILKAMEIDEDVALMATSWGLPQILGENYELAGYDSVQGMVLAFQEDEDNQLEAMISFVKETGLADELRRHEWAAFARGYNGPGYAKNRYDVKLRDAYAKWQRIRDTPYRPEMLLPPEEEVVTTAEVGAAVGDTPIVLGEVTVKDLYDGKVHPEIKAVQTRLDELGYPEVGELDGKWGTRTRAAVLAFRADNALPLTPTIDDALMAALMIASPRYINPERKNATLPDLRKEGAEDVKAADDTQVGGVISIGGSGILGIGALLDNVEGYGGIVKRAAEIVDPIKEVIQDNVWLILLGVGGYVFWKSGILKRIRLEKHQTGQDVSR